VIEILIFAAVSTLLYRLGMGPILFLVPLQVLYIRRGKKSFGWAAALTLVLIIVIGAALARRWGTGEALTSATVISLQMPSLVFELTVGALMIGGLALIQLPEMTPQLRLPRYPRVTRLVLATAITGILSVPTILYLTGNEAFVTNIEEFFTVLAESTNSAIIGAQSEALPITAQPIQTESLLRFIGMVLRRTYLFYYFLILTFGWWLGTIIGARSMGRHPGLTRVADFKLPDRYVWPLIASLALVVLNLIVPLEPLEVLAWNALLIFAFLYGISGLGIIRFLLSKLKVRPGIRWLLIIGIIILAMTPRIGIAVLILIPGLGVSEVWLKYRREERSNV
jgi:hypothetical protein